MPNLRNLNKVLGYIGKKLIELGEENNKDIPFHEAFGLGKANTRCIRRSFMKNGLDDALSNHLT